MRRGKQKRMLKFTQGLILLLSISCAPTQTVVKKVTLPRPKMKALPKVAIRRMGEGIFIDSFKNFIVIEIRRREHLKSLHAAPFWEGEYPKWLVD